MTQLSISQRWETSKLTMAAYVKKIVGLERTNPMEKEILNALGLIC